MRISVSFRCLYCSCQDFRPSDSVFAMPHSRGQVIVALVKTCLLVSDIFLATFLGGKNGVLIHAAIVTVGVFVVLGQHVVLLVWLLVSFSLILHRRISTNGRTI